MISVDLDIAISCGDLGLDVQKQAQGEKGTSLFNTRESKKKPGRIVGTFIKGVLTKVDLDSIEAKEQQKSLINGEKEEDDELRFDAPKISSS